MDEFVVCVDAEGARDITVGKAYVLIHRTSAITRVIDDVGDSTPYGSRRFKPLPKEENLDGWKTL